MSNDRQNPPDQLELQLVFVKKETEKTITNDTLPPEVIKEYKILNDRCDDLLKTINRRKSKKN